MREWKGYKNILGWMEKEIKIRKLVGDVEVSELLFDCKAFLSA